MFVEAEQMITYLSTEFAQKRDLKYFETYHLCLLFEEYLFVISEQAILRYGIRASRANHRKRRKTASRSISSIGTEHHHIKRLERLYPLHMKHIDRLNRNPLARHRSSAHIYKQSFKSVIDRNKIIATYADAFESYQAVNRAHSLRQHINPIPNPDVIVNSLGF